MTLNEYQQQAMTTCMDSCRNIPYMLFNLQGEVGELSSKIAKFIRKGRLCFSSARVYKLDDMFKIEDYGLYNTLIAEITDNEFEEIKAELGDVLWQLSGLCDVLGLKLEDVAEYNLNKLASRQQRGVIEGEGDNR